MPVAPVHVLPALLGQSKHARDHVVEHARALSLIAGDWKVIRPSAGPKLNAGNETGNDPQPQLFHLTEDPGEKNNLAVRYPDKVKKLLAKLEQIEKAGRSRP